ncbi:unnamed protein product [Symbiodinium necroappetens]|uniref:Uncharacterized protein n=1 Tax=Symbiodinium necroappetens TaxID=1628268 RepID=A0A812NK44_9DINO|nr:unnamed protein product [Symbiodinium necroappetens]
MRMPRHDPPLCSWRSPVQEDLDRLVARGGAAHAAHLGRARRRKATSPAASWRVRDGGAQSCQAARGGPDHPRRQGPARSPQKTRPVDQAENEVEMLAFLLEEADSSEAEVLLEMEAQLQEPKAPLVAAHLRAQIAELQGRQRSLSPPDREGHGDGDESSRDWAPMLAFLLGPSATFRYVSGGPLNQRRSLRRRSLQLLCWFASWKVWLEKRLAAYAAYFWYWELHSLEPPENRSARRKHLMQQAMAEQAAEEKQAQKAGAEPKESAEVASSAKQPEKEQRTATPEAPKPEETPEDTKEPEESKDSSEPREEAELTPLQQEHLKNLAKLLEEMQALQGMTPDPAAEG